MKLRGSCFEDSVQCEECVKCYSGVNRRRKVLLRNEIGNSDLLMNGRRGEAKQGQ